MLHTTTDQGDVVFAVGEEGSFMRIKTEWPGTIDRINTMHLHDHPFSEAEQMITEYMEINHPTFVYLVPQLMLCSAYHPH